METNNNTAQMIFAQLGGGVFVAMTGAKDFVADTNRLSFRLPVRFAAKGINHVAITLEASDTYTVNFSALRSLKLRSIAQHSDVYAENLQGLFTSETGLDTSMGRIGR